MLADSGDCRHISYCLHHFCCINTVLKLECFHVYLTIVLTDTMYPVHRSVFHVDGWVWMCAGEVDCTIIFGIIFFSWPNHTHCIFFTDPCLEVNVTKENREFMESSEVRQRQNRINVEVLAIAVISTLDNPCARIRVRSY